MDNQIKILASKDRYAKYLITIPGISYYAALLVSSEIADINRFPDYEHLSSYAKLVPGTHQPGETQYSKTDMKGSHILNWIMVQCTLLGPRLFSYITISGRCLVPASCI